MLLFPQASDCGFSNSPLRTKRGLQATKSKIRQPVARQVDMAHVQVFLEWRHHVSDSGFANEAAAELDLGHVLAGVEARHHGLHMLVPATHGQPLLNRSSKRGASLFRRAHCAPPAPGSLAGLRRRRGWVLEQRNNITVHVYLSVSSDSAPIIGNF